MTKEINKFIYWAPRILSILFILFLAVFSLDVFDGNYGFWGTLLGLLIHNIPSLALAILLIIAWKHEWVGAIVFALGGILYTILILISALKNQFEWYMISWILLIAGPAFLISALFYINWRKKK